MSKKNHQTEQVATNSLPDFFEALGNKCQWIALALLMIIAVIVFKDFLFFNKIFLYKDIGSDSLNFSDPLLCHTIRYMHDYGFPSWSFEFGMGQNAFAFTLFDPIDYLFFPFGIQGMRSLLGYKIVLEVIVSGFVFYHFLRTIRLNQFTSIIGSLLYAYSGFMIVGSCWFIFAAEVLTMAFILLGFEKLYRNNNLWILPFPIAYLVISRPFVLAPLTVFLLIYITFRVLSEGDFNLKHYLLTLVKTALAGLAGVLITAPWLLEHLKLMLESPRGSGANSMSGMLMASPMFQTIDNIQLGTAVYRLFASDILGSGNDFKGWMNIMEAPTFYCGLISLLLIPQLFFGTARRMKILYACFLACWLLPVVFPYFRYALAFFTGDYYRSYSFYVGLVLTLMAMQALHHVIQTKKVNLVGLGISLLALLALLYFPFFDDSDIKVSAINSFVTFALLAYTAFLFLLPKGNRSLQFALLGFVVLELSYLSFISINNRDILAAEDLTQKKGYNDHSVDAIAYLKKKDNGFYRIDKRFSSSPAIHASLNDGMAQGYYGTSGYNSFNQKYYIQYLKLMQIIQGKDGEAETRWAQGLTSRVILEALNGVKYMFTKQVLNTDAGIPPFYDSLTIFGDVRVLQNKFAMPLGFAYNNIMSLSDFQKMGITQRDFMSLKAAVVADSNLNEVSKLPKLSLTDTLQPEAFSLDILRNRTDSMKMESFVISSFKPTEIKGNIALQHPAVVYFSIPYDQNWTVTDGQQRELHKLILFDGMIGLYLEPGKHDLNFRFESSNLALGKKVMIAGVALMALLVFISMKYKTRES